MHDDLAEAVIERTQPLIQWSTSHQLVVRGDAESGAVFTQCDKYRPLLWRLWGEGGLVQWIMLNPSTADHEQLDPTLTRCRNYSQRWGYSGIVVTNIFDYRATKPSDMKKYEHSCSIYNTTAIDKATELADLIICGWGAHGNYRNQGDVVMRQLQVLNQVYGTAPNPHYLALTKAGEPRHPLYLRADLEPQPMRLGGAA